MAAGDVQLSRHFDNAEVTLNVSLGMHLNCCCLSPAALSLVLRLYLVLLLHLHPLLCLNRYCASHSLLSLVLRMTPLGRQRNGSLAIRRFK